MRVLKAVRTAAKAHDTAVWGCVLLASAYGPPEIRGCVDVDVYAPGKDGKCVLISSTYDGVDWSR